MVMTHRMAFLRIRNGRMVQCYAALAGPAANIQMGAIFRDSIVLVGGIRTPPEFTRSALYGPGIFSGKTVETDVFGHAGQTIESHFIEEADADEQQTLIEAIKVRCPELMALISLNELARQYGENDPGTFKARLYEASCRVHGDPNEAIDFLVHGKYSVLELEELLEDMETAMRTLTTSQPIAEDPATQMKDFGAW